MRINNKLDSKKNTTDILAVTGTSNCPISLFVTQVLLENETSKSWFVFPPHVANTSALIYLAEHKDGN